jgi:hypothetical protein
MPLPDGKVQRPLPGEDEHARNERRIAPGVHSELAGSMWLCGGANLREAEAAHSRPLEGVEGKV